MIGITKDRRAFRRMLINAPVTITQGSHSLVGICRDLSGSGMALFVDANGLDPAQPVDLSLGTCSNRLPPFRAQARIIRLDQDEEGYRLAVEFVTVF